MAAPLCSADFDEIPLQVQATQTSFSSTRASYGDFEEDKRLPETWSSQGQLVWCMLKLGQLHRYLPTWRLDVNAAKIAVPQKCSLAQTSKAMGGR